MSNKAHRGELLDLVVRRNNINKSKLIEKTGYNRSSYYYHIKQPDLAFNILRAYGKHIPYDFSTDFPEMRDESNHDDSKIITLEGMTEDRNFWKEEYNKQYKENQRLKEELEKLKNEKK